MNSPKATAGAPDSPCDKCNEQEHLVLWFEDDSNLCVPCLLRRDTRVNETRQQHAIAFNLSYILSDMAIRVEDPSQAELVKGLLLSLVNWYGKRVDAEPLSKS